MRTTSSPVVALNHAAAVAMSEGLERVEFNGIRGRQRRSRQLLSFPRITRGSLAPSEASGRGAAAYQHALSLTTNSVEQYYIRRRLRELT